MSIKIDLNKSDKKQLTEVKGIGHKKAERIITYRKNHGPFSNKKELMKVKGFGQSIFAKIKGKIEVAKLKSLSTDIAAIFEPKKVKITFNPSEYNLTEDIYEVHLVGEMNDWDPVDKSYALSKREGGVWEGVFSLNKGTEYKILYNSDSWDEGNDIGEYGENMVV